jgi:hypothetical protein
MINELSDAPLTNPADDLLGVAPSARILAAHLVEARPPFTAGVYGEWGSGKTSFFSFVAKYLDELIPRKSDGASSILFISFSAWQYKTADEIWRALLLTIAKNILNVPDIAPDPAPVSQRPPTLLGRIKRALARDALVIRPEELIPARESEYLELVAKLDASLYGGISKNQVQFDTGEMTIAITKSLVAGLAGISPMMSAARSLFGFSSDLDLAKMLDKSENQGIRQRIESMETLKKILRDLFAQEQRRVFVFVDDLDRCMPDAALDLLEAIKIFLDSTSCIFIVAGDEALIGQGLRLRLRELLQPTNESSIESFMSRKGREYFEKIIQLPVHLPRPNADVIQRLIGASFPEWFSASDLIDSAIGSNPRRLKQYCNRLQYQRMIFLDPTTSGSRT